MANQDSFGVDGCVLLISKESICILTLRELVKISKHSACINLPAGIRGSMDHCVLWFYK